MLRRKKCVALALAISLVAAATGCDRSPLASESDVSAEMTANLPMAAIGEEPLPYEIPINSGMGMVDGLMRVNEGEGYFEKYTGGFFPSAVVVLPEDVLIAPVHEGWKLALLPVMRGYSIQENACFWLEGSYTPEHDTDHWALYVQERQAGAEPVLLDEGTFAYEDGDDATDGFSRCLAFDEDSVLWANDDGRKVQVKHYNRIDDETTVLDTFAGNMDDVTVAMDDGHAAWTRPENNEVVYADLDDSKLQVVAEGDDIGDPLITGEYLIVRTGCDSEAANALWICDLGQADRQFDYQIDSTQVPSLGRAQHLETPQRIDSGRIALSATGSHAVYELTVVDLASATVFTTANTRTKEAMYFCPLDCFDNSLRAVSKDSSGALDYFLPPDKDGKTMIVMLRLMNNMHGDEELTQTVFPITFQWP